VLKQLDKFKGIAMVSIQNGVSPWVSLIWNNHYKNGNLSDKRPRGSFWWRAMLKQLDKFKGIAMVSIQNRVSP
jgi:hypothetical protein